MAAIQAAWQWYLPGLTKILNKEADLDSDNLVITAHTASYVPNRATHTYVSDLTSEVASGSGYTLGGQSLTAKTLATVIDTSLAAAAVTTAYLVNDIRRPSTANGYIYRIVVAGTSGGAAPTWPTVIGANVTDGGVTWECAGIGMVKFDAADVSWAASGFTWRYLVISDRTPATAATQPLLGIWDAGSTQVIPGGSLDVTFDAVGALGILV